MRTFILVIFTFLFFESSYFLAQDIHFSQYYFSPLSLNPANTGNFDGNYRFFGNYRSQWREISEAYDTYSAGGDFNFYPSSVQSSAGFLFINDRSGGNLNIIKILPSFAVHPRIGKWRFHLGLQPGFVIKSLDFYKNTFPNQLNWNTGIYDNSLPNGETGVMQSFSYFDFNAGAGLSRRFGKIEPELAFAFYHINQPNESFFDRNNVLPIRQAGNVALTFYATRHFSFKIHSMYAYTGRITDWVTGATAEILINKNTLYKNSVFFGFMWRSGFNRNPDAGITTLGFNYLNYTFGFSYDITISQLKTSVDSKGAFEIAIIYKAFNNRLSKRELNCERY